MRNLDFLVKVFFLMKFYIIFILTKISSCVIENFIVIIFYCNRKDFVNKAYPNRKKMHRCRTMHNSLLKTTKIFNFKKYVCKYAKLVCTIVLKLCVLGLRLARVINLQIFILKRFSSRIQWLNLLLVIKCIISFCGNYNTESTEADIKVNAPRCFILYPAAYF